MQQEKNKTSDRELRIFRILNAPVELVWEVWTNPEHIANWWGPNGFSNTIHKMDLQPSGEWLLTMHGPDGKNYPNKSIFSEIIPYKKIVLQHFNPNFTATIEFTSENEKTLLNWHMLFETTEVFDAVVKAHKADEGLKQNVEKLDVYLSKTFEPFVIERVFNAPVALVWKAITDRDEMSKWYFDLKAFKPEVGFEFEFYGGDKNKQWLHLLKVTEVIPEKKLTYSWRYDGYSGISYVCFELFPQGDKTILKLTHTGLESFPTDVVPEFKKENFVMGWTSLIGTSLKNYFEK